MFCVLTWALERCEIELNTACDWLILIWLIWLICWLICNETVIVQRLAPPWLPGSCRHHGEDDDRVRRRRRLRSMFIYLFLVFAHDQTKPCFLWWDVCSVRFAIRFFDCLIAAARFVCLFVYTCRVERDRRTPVSLVVTENASRTPYNFEWIDARNKIFENTRRNVVSFIINWANKFRIKTIIDKIANQRAAREVRRARQRIISAELY